MHSDQVYISQGFNSDPLLRESGYRSGTGIRTQCITDPGYANPFQPAVAECRYSQISFAQLLCLVLLSAGFFCSQGRSAELSIIFCQMLFNHLFGCAKGFLSSGCATIHNRVQQHLLNLFNCTAIIQGSPNMPL